MPASPCNQDFILNSTTHDKKQINRYNNTQAEAQPTLNAKRNCLVRRRLSMSFESGRLRHVMKPTLCRLSIMDVMGRTVQDHELDNAKYVDISLVRHKLCLRRSCNQDFILNST